jgi:hypothetical protein
VRTARPSCVTLLNAISLNLLLLMLRQ